MEEFSSLEELDDFIRNYEYSNCVQLWKRTAKTIEGMKTVCPIKCENSKPELKYYQMTYACKKGGRAFKTKGRGIRQSYTYRDNCPMFIKLALSDDGTKLKIVEKMENHNHPINRELFESMTKQRQMRLKTEDKKEAIEMLNINCNIKLVQAYLQEKTGKPIKTSDLKNLQSGSRCLQTDIRNVINLLTQDDGIGQIAVNENGDLLGIYHQTPYMRKCFATYAEFLVFDAIYKLKNLDMSLYILMSINGNDEGEVIAVFLLSDESSDVIRHMMKTFKEINPDWKNIKFLMTDKDFGEKTVLCDEFPEASHQLCLYHVLKHFRTAITTESMQINALQRKQILEILQKIKYSKSEAEYDEYYKLLMDLNIPKLTQYYKQNWHSNRHEWVKCFKRQYTLFNNHLESCHQKIKELCEKNSNIQSFFENFLVFLNSLKLKRRQTVHHMLLKKKNTSFEQDSPEHLYLQLVTPFAFNLIREHMNNVNDYDVLSENATQFQVQNKNCDENVNTVELEDGNVKCCCPFNTTTTLPCSHVFSVLKTMKTNIYDESLIPERFLRATYVNCYTDEGKPQTSVCDLKLLTKEQCLGTHQKYRKAILKCQKIASIISHLNMEEFENYCDELDTIVNLWSERKKTVIVELADYESESATQREDLMQHQSVTQVEEAKPLIEALVQNNIQLQDHVIEEDPLKIDISLPTIGKRRQRAKRSDLTVKRKKT
ncbi:zinc finger SWIM domain-containing protein 1 [Plutella xylostella]|uniref:zinc finger SWIM domain-containing protein 1 n=1 Tax=Plutella xylostella TaxID=51655 RepID=UPI002032E057|nr:zinc finger SWIM domain-containing protein 1 [Plutella xylostella]